MTAELNTEPAYTPHQPQAAAAHTYDLVQAQEQVRRALRSVLESVAIGLPPVGTIAPAALTDAQISQGFDSTGKGRFGTSYYGWAIANGNNGTPDLSNRFVRLSTTASGATGGSDTNSHTHTEGDIIARISVSGVSNDLFIDRQSSPASWSDNFTLTGGTVSGTSVSHSTGAKVDGTTDAPSDTENRPAFWTGLAIMRVAVS